MVERLDKKGFIIQFDQPTRAETVRNRLLEHRYFTDTVSIPDIRPPRLGLYLLGLARGSADALMIGVLTGTTATELARVKFKKALFFQQWRVVDLISSEGMGPIIAAQILERNNSEIHENVFNEMIRRIIRRQPDLEQDIDKLVRIANGIDFDAEPEKVRIFSQQQDALACAIRSAGMSTSGIEDKWEVDEFSASSTYLDGFLDDEAEQHVTEDEIIIHDQHFFPDMRDDGNYRISTRVFSDRKNRLFVTMANRTAIERVLGVDLVYFNEADSAFCLVQYKRMTKQGASFVYYASSDGNYEKDISLMEEHTKTLHDADCEALNDNPNGLYSNYRAFGSPFFFKFTRSSQFKPFSNSILAGLYLPFDMWNAYSNQCAASEEPVKASEAALPKHLTTTEFCGLLKRGVIGSRSCTAELIKRVLASCLNGERGVVFAYRKSRLPDDDLEALDEEIE